MTVTPRISVPGMRSVLGESASKTNLLTPTGMGPTSRLSSSWSCSELQDYYRSASIRVGGVSARDGRDKDSRGRGADVGQLPLEVLLQRLQALKGDFELVRRVEGRGVVAHAHVQNRHGCHAAELCYVLDVVVLAVWCGVVWCGMM